MNTNTSKCIEHSFKLNDDDDDIVLTCVYCYGPDKTYIDYAFRPDFEKEFLCFSYGDITNDLKALKEIIAYDYKDK